MKFPKKLSKHRHKIVPAVVLIVAASTALIFRTEVTAWFSGQAMPTASAPTSGTKVDVGPFAVTARFSPDPPRQKGNTLIVTVRDDQGEPVEDAEVSLRYRMPPMGSMQEMKGEADVTSRDEARYEAKFDLPMGGSWELTLDIKKGEQSGEAVFNMTVGTPGLTAIGQGASSGESAAAEALPAHAFDEATLARLHAAIGAYEQIRALLAKDSIDGLDAQAKQVVAALDAAAKGATAIPVPIVAAFRRASEAATQLAKAADAETARAPFGELSRELVALAGADPRLSEGLHIFKCTMAEGFQKWFQPNPRLENPYMGQKMPECGVRTKWASAGVVQGDAHDHAQGGDDEISHYTCSMHPSVKQDGPGTCPICAMDLTPVTKQEVETGTIFVDEIRRQRIGVRTDTVKKRKMILQVRAVGAVQYDESRLHDVNLRMSGWVQRLSVDETGQRVEAGQTLFTLYSPELYAAQLEHLASMKRKDEGGEMLAQLAQSSRTRLRLLGMNSWHVSALEKRGKAWENVPIPSPASGYVIEKQIVDGARVEAGTRVYRIADLSKIWVDAEIYESDLPHVKEGQSVVVELPYVKDKRFEGQVDYVYPTLDEQTRTGHARIVLDNPALELKPDMYANVSIDVDLGERLSVPDSAVVYTGPRRLVFVDLSEGKLQPKVVELGVHVDGFYEVTDGLNAGDVVVTSGNFLIAAESRIRSAAKYWESSDVAE